MKVEVINVGQGDSFVLKPDIACVYNTPLIVDVGTQKAKVADRLTEENYHLLLTHSHKDHVGGFPKLYRDKNIESLTIPYFLPEIMNIAKFIKKHVSLTYGTLDWRKVNKIKNLNLVCEGDYLCDHIRIFNPPKNPYSYFSKFENGEHPSIIQALAVLEEYGFDLDRENIINYNSPITYPSEGDIIDGYNPAREFVHLFFRTLSTRLNSNPFESANYYANAHLELTANQASIVFKYLHKDGDWLFTGDADQSVFERLIDRYDSKYPLSKNLNRIMNKEMHYSLSSKYLKVPHHGSRENLSTLILSYISPEVAFVSHNNRKFGRSKDCHPHHEIIDLLDINKIRTYYTNPVIKNGTTIKNAASGKVEGGVLEFI
jgi:beta-lactamase superfamily II metal-dependent hydrolase